MEEHLAEQDHSRRSLTKIPPRLGTLEGMPRLRSDHYDYDDVADIVAATLERSLLLTRAHYASQSPAVQAEQKERAERQQLGV